MVSSFPYSKKCKKLGYGVLICRYRALAGQCARALRLEVLLSLCHHLHPLAMTSHLLEHDDNKEVGWWAGGRTCAA